MHGQPSIKIILIYNINIWHIFIFHACFYPQKSSGGRSFNIISVALQLLWVMEHIVYVWVFW